MLKELDMLHKRVAELEKLVANSSASRDELMTKTGELERVNIKLQESDRMKTIFIANMSHELRTPLNSIIGFTGLVLRGLPGRLNDDQRRQLSIVRDSASQLLDLIDEILDLSYIEADMIELSVDRFTVAELVEEALIGFVSTITAKKLRLIKDVPQDTTILGDRKRIKQIVTNIISNAVKYTADGSITVSAKVVGGKLQIRVVDTGAGMKKEYLSRIFRPFQQIEMVRIRTHQGTGLGLYLSTKIANLMGGDITVSSEYGVGSEFVYTTPVELAE